MRLDQEQTVLTVLHHSRAWAVECEGEHFGHSTDKEMVMACARQVVVGEDFFKK